MSRPGVRKLIFSLKNFNLQKFIEESLKEDLGDGDHTSLACIDPGAKGKARLVVKEKGIIAGVELARRIFLNVDRTLYFTLRIPDGKKVKKGDVAFLVSGSQQSILKAERLVLNCMQRMSGIATQTAALVHQCQGTKTKILDTRKTTPGLRALEKWAVTAGGGYNHRFGLYDMILIKDNHIDYAGSIRKAIEKTKKYLSQKKKKLKIEIEARNIDEVKKILAVGKPNRILLDNFTPSQVKKAVTIIGKKSETEASGGITKKNIRKYAKTGVDYISVGALTHSVKSLDMSLKAVK